MKKRYYLISTLFVALIGLFSMQCISSDTTAEKKLSFDTNKRFQVIEGFGSCVTNYKKFPSEYSDPEFFDRVVNDLGISIVRVPLMEHTEWKNDDDDPNHFNWNNFWLKDNMERKGIETSMNLMNEFKKRGVNRFMGTPWSPPEFTKTNRSPIQGGYLRSDMFEEYAEYMAAQIILAKKNYGIDLNWVTMQNELLFAQFYRSCVYQPWVLKEALRALMHKFEKEGIKTRILMPEDMMFIERMLFYIEPTMNDPETKNYDGHFTTHRRGGKDELQEWVTETNQYHRQTWMTETSGHDQTWEGALKMASDIHDYLVYGNFSAWVYWQLSGDGDGKYSILVDGKPGNKYYASKHFYRYVRPGAYRIAASEDAELSISAFHHPYDGTLTSVIINNNNSEVKRTIDSEFEYEVHATTASEKFKKAANLQPGNVLTIPAKCIITIQANNNKLKTTKEKPYLPEAWKVPAGTENEIWGNSEPFPRKRSFQIKPDGGNISIYDDLVNSDKQEIINERMHNGWSLLHYTIMNGDGDAAKYLIESGADINAKANDGLTPLHMAASIFNGNSGKHNKIEDMSKYDIFKLVMDAKPDLNATTNDGWTALHAAVISAYTGWRQDASQSLNRITDLIDTGADLEAKDMNGKTALHWACRQGYLRYTGVPSVHNDVVKLLIEKGANINTFDNSGKTPLHHAVEMAYPEITLAMVEAGAKTDIKDKNGETPASIAKKSESEILAYILKNGKMPEIKKNTVKISLNDAQNIKFGPELLKAAWAGDIEKVKELLKKGADLEYRDTDGFNAIERARDNGHDEIVKLLQKAKS